MFLFFLLQNTKGSKGFGGLTGHNPSTHLCLIQELYVPLQIRTSRRLAATSPATNLD